MAEPVTAAPNAPNTTALPQAPPTHSTQAPPAAPPPPAAAAPPGAAPPPGASAAVPPPGATPRQVWAARTLDYVRRGSQAAGLDALTFVAVATGAAAMALLLLMTLFSWYSFRHTM